MLQSLIRISAALGVLSLAACSSGDDDSSGTGGSGGTGGSSATGGTGGSSGSADMSGGSAGMVAGTCESTIVTTPEKNYEFSSELSIKVTQVKPSSDITFDWSTLAVDFLQKPIDLDQVGMFEVALFKMGISDFEKGLNDDTLDMMDVEIIASINLSTTHATSGSILDIEPPAGPIPDEQILEYLDIANYPPANHIYTAMIADGSELGKHTRMLHGFALDASSTNTHVDIKSDSTSLVFDADIASRPVTNIPAGTPDVTIDWSKMEVTASGGEFLPQQVTRIRVGSYTQTPAELEGDNFLKLDELAVEMFEFDIESGTKVSFNKTATKAGKAFAGIDATHTWIVALNCGNCQNPAPWYLSVLKPCP